MPGPQACRTVMPMTTRSNRRRAVTAGLSVVAGAAAAFLAWGPALADTPPLSPSPTADAPAAGAPAHVPAVADPVFSGTDLVTWNKLVPVQIEMQQESVAYVAPASAAMKGRHDTTKNTIQNVR